MKATRYNPVNSAIESQKQSIALRKREIELLRANRRAINSVVRGLEKAAQYEEAYSHYSVCASGDAIVIDVSYYDLPSLKYGVVERVLNYLEAEGKVIEAKDSEYSTAKRFRYEMTRFLTPIRVSVWASAGEGAACKREVIATKMVAEHVYKIVCED